ncbi:MAG: hypothetical protein MUF62_04445 [Chitinophagaceae bacterium]|nr:hypothetical protein [Chitinophagaceae bacterium]
MYFGNYGWMYALTIGLQGFCAWHSFKRGTQQKWIWIIVFLPLVGSVVYLFSEVFSRGDVQQVQAGVSAIINPSGHIKKLQERLRFADTFQNRILLADAYFNAGMLAEAVEIYEYSLQGNFAENEHVLTQLCMAYTSQGQYSKAVEAGRRVAATPQFARSRAHIAYAQALAGNGQAAAAEAEFKKMAGKYANFEARYQYGQFLLQQQRPAEALHIWRQLVEEGAHLSSIEKREAKAWVNAARQALKTNTVA